jgi:GDP-L-fucose synthase
MKVLVTGGTGFIGTALSKRLIEKGHQVERLGRSRGDLTSSEALNAFTSVKYDRIFHLAAWTQAGDYCLHHAAEQWLLNQQINTHVLAWWQKHQPQAKLIAFGTSCAYDAELPLVEQEYLKGAPIESLYAYGQSKRMMYIGMLTMHKQYGMKYLHVIPSTLYGPSYHTDGRQMHFIFDLIRKILIGKLHGKPVVLWGDGYQMRELVFLDDFVDIVLRLDDKAENQTVNVGGGEQHTIRHFAELISRHVDFDPNRIEYDTNRYVGARSKCLNVTHLRSLLPDVKMTPLPKGLGVTIDWFLEHRDTLLKPTS